MERILIGTQLSRPHRGLLLRAVGRDGHRQGPREPRRAARDPRIRRAHALPDRSLAPLPPVVVRIVNRAPPYRRIIIVLVARAAACSDCSFLLLLRGISAALHTYPSFTSTLRPTPYDPPRTRTRTRARVHTLA